MVAKSWHPQSMDPIVPPGSSSLPASPPMAQPGPDGTFASLPSAPGSSGFPQDTLAPPDPSTGASAGQTRPWWGLGDVLLSIPFIFGVAIVGTIIAGIVEVIISGELDAESLGDTATVPASIIVIGGLAQQAAQFVWPWIVSKWKGLGMKADWWFEFKWIDLLWGALTAVAIVPLSFVVSESVSWLVGLEDDAAADNTALLTDNVDSPWFIGILITVIIGAPLTEEVFFRGLCLQAFRRRGGDILAVVGSSLAFMLPHLPTSDFTLDGAAVLWATILMIGVVLAVLTLKVKRLGPAIVAHVLFNSFGTVASLVESS